MNKDQVAGKIAQAVGKSGAERRRTRWLTQSFLHRRIADPFQIPNAGL